MRIKALLFSAIICLNFWVCGIPIETPEFDERNEFVIRSPDGWGYRTFNGKNGLIGVLWPSGTSFNSTDTIVFIFIQNNNEKLPKVPANINIFNEKCPNAGFKFASLKDEENETLSIAETYFSGRCGRTMILFKESVENYAVIIAFISAKPVLQKQLSDVKRMAAAYRREIEKYLKITPEETSEENQQNNLPPTNTTTIIK
ncbi:MAG: hypothetical protein LBF44_02530 [Holosporaceae bacterium]|nr:hypothetical protein [Holosporaceae bacterium]